MAQTLAQTSRAGRRLLQTPFSRWTSYSSLHTSARLRQEVTSTDSVSQAAATGEKAAVPGPSPKSSSSSTDGKKSVSDVSQARPNSLIRNTLQLGPTHQSRYLSYYQDSLARDLQYLTYDHALELRDPADLAKRSLSKVRTWDSNSPYSKHRPARPNKGLRRLVPSEGGYVKEVVDLEKIVISSYSRDAVMQNDKTALIPLLAAMRAITGKTIKESDADPIMNALRSRQGLPKTGHINVVYAKKNVASFKLRKGQACGVRAELHRNSAYDFLEILTTFVLPRLRNFNGFALPNKSEGNPSNSSGAVSLGFPPEAFNLFPQLEVNWDSYPNKMPGFQVEIISNQRGRGATEKTRKLLSGLGIPFLRKGDM